MTNWLREREFHRPPKPKAVSNDRGRNAKLPCPFASRLRFPSECYQWTSPITNRQGAFCRPSVSQSPRNCCFWDALQFRPFSKRHCRAVECQKAVAPPIASLLRACGPSAVGRPVIRHTFLAMPARVVAIVVNAVQRHAGRPLAHVSKECLEGPPPSLADRDTAPSVVCESMVGCGVASRQHVTPCAEGGGARPAVGSDRFSLNASASLVAIFANDGSMRVAAVTLAQPQRLAKAIQADVMNGDKPPKPLSSPVFYVQWDCGRIHSSHVPVSFGRRNVVRAAGRFPPSGCSHCSITEIKRQ